MGAITRIRQISPYFLAVIATLFIVFMVMQDSSCTSIRNNRPSAESMAAAIVNGEVITVADFEARVKETIENQRQQNPNQEIDDEIIRQQIFDEMINEVLRRQEAEKLGIVVTPQQIIDMLVTNPPPQFQFGKDSLNNFDPRMQWTLVTQPESVKDLLERNGLTLERWKGILLQTEDYLRMQLLQQALASTLGAVASTPSAAVAKQDYIRENSTADIEFLALSSNRVADADVKVSESDIASYYEKNKQFYVQRPARSIKYLVFPQIPSKDDTVNAQKKSMRLAQALGQAATAAARDSVFAVEMSNLRGSESDFTPVNELDPNIATALSTLNAREVFGPLNIPGGIAYYRLDERREGVNPVARASHILISFDGMSKDSAKAQAQTVMARVKKGEDFAELARTFSKDPGSAQQGGDLNYFGRGRMVAAFDSAVFNSSVGAIVGPVETQFGYHIIKVTDKTSIEYKYSTITLKTSISSATKRAVAAAAQQALDAINNGETIESVGARYKNKFYAVVQQSPLFRRETPILQTHELTAWAFENEVGAAIRREVKYYGTVIAQVSDVREAGIMPLQDVRERIVRVLTERAKLKKLEAQAKQLASSAATSGLSAARGGDSTIPYQTQAGIRNNGMITGYGGEYMVTAKAFSLPVGQVSGAIMGERGWFIIKVLNRTDADLTGYTKDIPAQLQSVSTRLRGNAFGTWFQKLRENSEIIDKRFSSRS
jgi:parvulin-like peptidyl-prolyl isomerase